jgi:hypothetical protein
MHIRQPDPASRAFSHPACLLHVTSRTGFDGYKKKRYGFFYTGRKKFAKRIKLYVEFIKTAEYLCRTFPTV